ATESMETAAASGRVHNALTVTCRIPPELLSLIFEVIVEKSIQETPGTIGHYRSNLRWIPSICHICLHWREVAFHSPSLWSNIPIDFPQWAAEMLRLSKDAPLTIIYRDTLYSSSSAEPTISYALLTNILSSHAQRIRHLTLESRAHVKRGVFEPRDHWKSLERYTELFTLMEQPFPILERLEIILEESRNYDRISDATINSSSRLKYLILQECGVTWNPAAFSNITHFEISRIRGSMNPSALQLLDVLLHTPFLETLSISDIPFTLSIDAPESQSICPVRLDYLRDVRLSCDFFSAAFLIDRIHFPRDIRTIELQLWASPSLDRSQLDEHGRHFITRLARRIKEDIEGSISRLELWGTIKAWKSLNSSALARPSVPPTVDLNIKDHWQFSIELRDSFWQLLCLDHLTTLVVMDISACFDTATWLIFGALPHLEIIQVYSNEHALMTALSRGMETDTTLAPLLSFVSLKTLSIRGWDLYKHAERLSYCLRSRGEAGSELKLLKLNGCRDVDQDDLTCLKKIVEAVEWDGEGGVSDEEDDIAWVPQYSL
ncbi:hypothetical protein H0H92_002863, partial [Tricholoma furcatifolium]